MRSVNLQNERSDLKGGHLLASSENSANLRSDWTAAERIALGGLLSRRERWGLSLRGKCLLIIVAVGLLLFVILTVYPFLAVTHRVDADVLVVEGWVHPYAIQAAANEFKTGSYKVVLSTGGPVVGKGGYINDYNTSASVGADLLKKTDLPPELIKMVPSRVSGRDRTYNSALALKKWLFKEGLSPHGINIVTQDVHARRTRLLFQKALGRDTAVGIIAVPSPDYNSGRWWRSSEAAEEVIGEAVGYIYAVLFIAFDS
jgi:uncharacterized SAM-binding protein YcdF (DUF218 family)